MKTTTIRCDVCEKDLTYTGNCEAWRIVLGSEAIPNYPDSCTVTDMAWPPDFSKDLHFCGWRCLAKWGMAHLPSKAEAAALASVRKDTVP